MADIGDVALAIVQKVEYIVMPACALVALKIFEDEIKTSINRLKKGGLEAGGVQASVELSPEIEIAEQRAAAVVDEHPSSTVHVPEDTELLASQSRLNSLPFGAWRELERAVKILARCYFKDYCAAHGTIVGIARLRHGDIATESEYRAVSWLRDVVYDRDFSNDGASQAASAAAVSLTGKHLPPDDNNPGGGSTSAREASSFATSAAAVTRSIEGRIQWFRDNGGEERYQEVMASFNPDIVIRMPKNPKSFSYSIRMGAADAVAPIFLSQSFNIPMIRSALGSS